MDNYDFYGNYNKEDKSFSIYEIHKKQRQKEIRRLGLYQKILNRCFSKIRLCVEKDNLYCFFKLPEYMSGSPLYNMTDCLFYMLNELAKNGFAAKYCHPLMIYITWPQKEKNLKLEYNQEENDNLNKFKNEINLKYNETNSSYNEMTKPNTKINYEPITLKSTNDYKSESFNNEKIIKDKRVNDTNNFLSISNLNNVKNVNIEPKKYKKPVYNPNTFSKPVYNPNTFSKPVYNSNKFNKPKYSKPIFNKQMYKPNFNKPKYNKPGFNKSVYKKPIYIHNNNNNDYSGLSKFTNGNTKMTTMNNTRNKLNF